MTITLNRDKTLQYCLECKTVIFAEATEKIAAEKKEFYGEVSPVGAY
jgi:hypothetical protein